MRTVNRPSDSGRQQAEVVSLAAQPGGPEAIGELLRMRREELGLDLQDISHMLRIRHPYLDAIERGRVDELPGPTYVVGFVRAYADYLGLESGQIVDRFKEETKALGARTTLVFPSPLPEGKIPSGAILLLAVIFAMTVYGGWIYLSATDRPITSVVPQLPDRLAALIASEPGGETAASSQDAVEAEAPAAASEAVTASPKAEPSAAPPPATGQVIPPAPETVAEKTANAATTVEPTATAVPDAAAGAPAVDDEPLQTEAVTDPPSGNGMAATEQTAAAASEQSAAAVVPMTPSAAAPDPAPRQEDELPQAPSLAAPPAADPTPSSPAAETPLAAADAADQEHPNGTGARDVAAEEADASARTAQVFGLHNEDARIVIRAAADSWIEVRAPGGEILLTRVLRAGDVYRVPDRTGLTLITGNAGGLAIVVDGEPVPPLGPVGSVRRNVLLDPDILRSGTGHIN